MRDMQNHLLVEHNVSTSLQDWKLWKKRWDEELAREYPHAEVLMGLLHVVFKRFRNEELVNEELVCLCLEVADGCNSFRSDFKDQHLVLYDGEKGAVKYCARSEVMKKAWRVLCDNVFKNTARDVGSPSWAQLVVQPDVFHKLMWFFRVGESQVDDNIPLGHDQSHYDKLALKFIREFIAFAWKFSGTYSSDKTKEQAEQVLEMFTAARPQFVEILNRIDNLRFLLSKDIDVDKQILAKLKEIALQGRFLSEGPYRSVEEAYADNSKAAEVLILLKIRQKEEERQRKIKQAKRQKRQANDELVKLGAGAN